MSAANFTPGSAGILRTESRGGAMHTSLVGKMPNDARKMRALPKFSTFSASTV